MTVSVPLYGECDAGYTGDLPELQPHRGDGASAFVRLCRGQGSPWKRMERMGFC